MSGKLTSPQGHVPWAGAKATHHTYGGRGGAGPSQPPPRRVKFTQSPTPISPGAPRKPAHLTPPLAPPCLPVGQNILGAVMGTPGHTRAAQMACGSPRRVSRECGIKAPLFWGFLGPFALCTWSMGSPWALCLDIPADLRPFHKCPFALRILSTFCSSSRVLRVQTCGSSAGDICTLTDVTSQGQATASHQAL